jgi:sugar phosphate isomerase/epimerase
VTGVGLTAALATTTSAPAFTAAQPAITAAQPANTAERPAREPFGYCFNTSTIRGQKLGIIEQVEVASKAGYQGFEPWLRDITAYTKAGGTLRDLKKRITDAGLSVESAIAFSSWIVDDEQQRAKGLEQAKRDMDVQRQIGGKRIAAPPVGATRGAMLDLFKAAKRYRALLELGDEMGVVPQVEVWGFSKNLSRLGESIFVAVESGHPKACLLPDVYHIYKGGSDFAGLGMLTGSAIGVFHVNDYPADPPRETINDSHRVYPGDGVAPLKAIFTRLAASGFRGMLSLELFNPDYWKQDALKVARTGLEKTREAVQKSFS